MEAMWEISGAIVKDDGSDALGLDACFASGWYDKLHGYVANFINATGLSMLEADGPYGGAPCASTNHSHHHGLEDSIYRQTQLQSQFYKEMRARNVYVNQPDNFFFQGGSRTAMGYDEQQYSLSRWHDLTISRAGLFDDLYVHLPTQGWLFLPLGDYHAGGGAATFGGHPAAYEWALAQYLGAGTAACYRGPTLWTEGTPEGATAKAALVKWVGFYKKHRQTLIEPIVHLRRPDAQGWDGWLHVRPLAKESSAEVGVAMLFNPTDAPLNVSIVLPLYYTGLDATVQVSIDEGAFASHTVPRDYGLMVELAFAPRSIHTVVVRRP